MGGQEKSLRIFQPQPQRLPEAWEGCVYTTSQPALQWAGQGSSTRARGSLPRRGPGLRPKPANQEVGNSLSERCHCFLKPDRCPSKGLAEPLGAGRHCCESQEPSATREGCRFSEVAKSLSRKDLGSLDHTVKFNNIIYNKGQ